MDHKTIEPRTYLERETVFPSEEAQALYPAAAHPCGQCRRKLPYLVDSRSEFYWHHGDARVGCARFGKSKYLGAPPREGTAVATYNERELARQREAD